VLEESVLLLFCGNSGRAFQTFSKFITMLIERAGFIQIWSSNSLSTCITERRTSPLGYRDLASIRDAVQAALRIAARGRVT
jgi:hypothetical protein